MKIFLILATLFPGVAFASQLYALELSAPCSMQVTDSAGLPQTVTEPAGYVANVAVWDGVTAFMPTDPCGQPETKVMQINGSPALGSGDVTKSP